MLYAGFASASITPSIGTRMIGFGGRDKAAGCHGVHDDLFVRALYLTQGTEKALILSFDLCFLGRDDVDRLKEALGHTMGLASRQILLNTSHTHTGPAVGAWSYAGFAPPETAYLRQLDAATFTVARQALAAARPVTLRAGMGRTNLPLNRRRRDTQGHIAFAPNPGGVTYDGVPVCLMETMDGVPVCLLFSVSCHPSTIGGHLISADYPGEAMRRLDEHLGANVSLFLQGTAGDTKARVTGDGPAWRNGTWKDVEQAGMLVAEDVLKVVNAGLPPVEPALRSALIEQPWRTQPPFTHDEYEAIVADPGADPLRGLWAERMLQRLDQGETLPAAIPVTTHGMQLARGVRLIGLEGEAVAELGLLMRDYYGDGIIFPLGYTDGAQLYLPTSHMLEEGGYEAESYYEYGHPAPLAPGIEDTLRQSLDYLYREGIL